MESIIGNLITGVLALIGVMVTNVYANKKIEQQLVTGQAVTDVQIKNLDAKIADLTDEVRKHNAFGDRIARLEVKVAELEKGIKQ